MNPYIALTLWNMTMYGIVIDTYRSIFEINTTKEQA